MRKFFAIMAVLLITAGWAVDPLGLRERVAAEVRPDAEIIEEMRAGVEVIAAALSIRAPDLGEEEREARY
jgi:hypothetical protein